MKILDLIGNTLDEKYKIERELGRGGMGAVYLATHVGTERAVAVKVIAPEFMRRAEFVERFRREARAAGRLRHPNVVDVTDFGIAETDAGNMAYLVMEYLDGCTLGEVLEEEKQLPLSWTLDILEQTCSAVDEAHQQGIIHRDLKPDNIWLEPNARGGYTVKVLDFGIAKLEEPSRHHEESNETADEFENKSSLADRANESETLALPAQPASENLTLAFPSETSRGSVAENATLAFEAHHAQSAARQEETLLLKNDFSESKTIAQNSSQPDENGTAIFNQVRATAIENTLLTNQENIGTKILAAQTTTEKDLSTETAALTRVGAVLGTPLYMSPEQCRGEKLDPRADVYSLGIIAYQMLGGSPPFTGKYTEVLEAHKTAAPPPLLEAKKVPNGVKQIIYSAMEKTPDARPATALAFASKLRSHSEGIGTLLRRALVIWSEHLPTFLGLSLILSLPIGLWWTVEITIEFLAVLELIPSLIANPAVILLALTSPLVNVFFGSIMLGVTTWIVTQLFAAPLSPVRLRPAFREARKHLRTFAGTVMAVSLASVIGLAFCFAGLYLMFRFALLTPVVMMEGLRGRAALRRSYQLVRRSWRTVAAATFLHFFTPVLLMVLVAAVTELSFKGAIGDKNSPIVVQTAQTSESSSDAGNAADENREIKVHIRADSSAEVSEEVQKPAETPEARRERRFNRQLRQTVVRFLQFLINILLFSFSSVVTALLYLKTRQAGGESLPELLRQFEDDKDDAQRTWQRRIHQRLAQSGARQTTRHTSRQT